MADQVVFNTAALDAYEALLQHAPDKLGHLAVAAVKRTLVETKKQQQLDFRRSRNRAFRAIANSVEFTEPIVNGSNIQSRLGVRKGGAGSLGNIAVYGTYKGGGTHMHPAYYLGQEIPRARRDFSQAMREALTS